jgi:hypothetical protein
MNSNDIQSLLISENNIHNLRYIPNDDWNVKKLLGVNIDQSQAIRFGSVFQQFIKDLVKACGGQIIEESFLDVYQKSIDETNKGKKDVDIWFTFNSKMYYFEAKTNLNLDSEKILATDKKVEDIYNYIQENNSDIEVVNGVLTCWYTFLYGRFFQNIKHSNFISGILRPDEKIRTKSLKKREV